MTPSVPHAGTKWLRRIGRSVYVHLVEPFLETHDPLPRVAWGAAVGLFIGLTPTVGIQMYLVTLAWLVSRYVLRRRFNLTIAISMVWVSNPITMIPLYFLFLKTGDMLLAALGYHVVEMSFDVFQAQVSALAQGASVGWLRWLLNATQVLIVEFGWPIVLGSLLYAVPLGIAAHPVTLVTLHRYRRYLAEAQGMDYEAWRAHYESKT